VGDELKGVARPSYLSRRPDGRYYIQTRLGKQSAAIYGAPLLRVTLRTADFKKARSRLVANLGWVAEIIKAPISRHLGRSNADKLFMRVRSVIKDGFADPDFGPCEAAARAGISLRYLQKMFTQRGSTCSEFIYSFRLDHAARLLQRRAALDASQALSEIAYASGFRDYRHFARRFRHRFGHAPGGGSPEDSRALSYRNINHSLTML